MRGLEPGERSARELPLLWRAIGARCPRLGTPNSETAPRASVAVAPRFPDLDARSLRERPGDRMVAPSWLDPALDAYVNLRQNRGHTIDQYKNVLGAHPGLRRKIARWRDDRTEATSTATIERVGKRRFFEKKDPLTGALYPIWPVNTDALPVSHTPANSASVCGSVPYCASSPPRYARNVQGPRQGSSLRRIGSPFSARCTSSARSRSSSTSSTTAAPARAAAARLFRLKP